MSDELKPCPFCGQSATTNGGVVTCSNEMCEMYYVRLLGAGNWQLRPIEDTLRAENASLREALHEQAGFGTELAGENVRLREIIYALVYSVTENQYKAARDRALKLLTPELPTESEKP